MSWKTRGRHGKKYCYAYRNGHIRYVGTETSPAAMRATQEAEARQKLRQERQALDQLANLEQSASKTIDLLLASQMLTNGYTFRKGEWRRQA